MPVIDVFVRVWPQSRFRGLLAAATVHRLAMFSGARIVLLANPETWRHVTPSELLPEASASTVIVMPVNEGRDWVTGRWIADSAAETDVYCMIDDDCLPIGANWLERGAATLREHADYAMLASWSINGEVEWMAGGEDVQELESVGTPSFVRRGAFADAPEGPADKYDIVLCEHLRTRGRVGAMRLVRHNHAGCEFSQVIPGHWAA